MVKNENISLKDVNGQKVSIPVKIANIFNSLFCIVSSDLRESITLERDCVPTFTIKYNKLFNVNMSCHSLFFYPTSKKEIKAINNSLPNRKAPGLNNITPVINKFRKVYVKFLCICLTSV